MAFTTEQEAKLLHIINAYDNGKGVGDFTELTKLEGTEFVEAVKNGISYKAALNNILKGTNEAIEELELSQPNKYSASWVAEDLSPTSDKQYGNSDVADCWRPYLVDCTKNTPDAKNIIGELSRNNFLHFKDGSFAPVVGITDAMRAECDVELYLDAAHASKYCDAGQFNATSFYNEHGMSKLYNASGTEVRVLRPWETTSKDYTVLLGTPGDRYFIDNEIGNSGKKWKAVFEYPTRWDGVNAKKLKRTGIAPGPSTTVDNKFRNFFFLYNTGDSNTKSANGTADIITMFSRNDRNYPRVNDISQLSSVTRARANNADTSLSYPFSESGMFATCAFLSSMEIKHKTKALHDAILFGSGISSNDSCSNEAQYLVNGGTRYSIDDGTTWVYSRWNEQNGLYHNTSGGRTHMSNMFNEEYPKEQCLESQIAASFASELGVTEGIEFEVYGSTYYYKNIPGVNGLFDGEMNVRVYKLMGENISAFDASGNALPARVECVLRMSLVNGYNLTGDIFCYEGGGCEVVGTCTNITQGSTGAPIKVYLESDQRKFHSETSVSKNDLGVFDFESAYPLMGEYTTFNGYRKSLAPYTIAGGEAGGSLLTGECAYVWGANYWSGTIDQRVRVGLRRRGFAASPHCCPRALSAYYSVSYTTRTTCGSAQAEIA